MGGGRRGREGVYGEGIGNKEASGNEENRKGQLHTPQMTVAVAPKNRCSPKPTALTIQVKAADFSNHQRNEDEVCC